MALEVGEKIACPGNDDLRKLLRGKHAEARQDAIENHLNDCSGCRGRLELMADGDTNLSDIVRHIDTAVPKQDSAYWKAFNSIEFDANITSTFAGLSKNTPNDHPPGKLEFLKPSEQGDKLGKLGDFEIMREIGRGGMGVVLQALDPHLDREVAIKVLDPQMAGNDTARQRFCREARAAAAVTHDNIVTVFQVNEDESAGLPYLVMQLIKGESLEQKIRRSGKVSVAATVRYALHAASGLAAAHAAGLIHRDIKPGNILIEESTDKATLSDFGLARAAEDLKLTRTGFVAGTPLYMAPEQARGDDIDARADLFSLGSVMYEALAGRPPFEGNSALAVLRRVADEQHPRLSRLNPEVPDWLEDVVDQLLEKKPEHRIASAEALQGILGSRICELEPDPNTPVPAECSVGRSASRIFGRRRSAWWTTAIVVATPFLIGGAAGAVLGYGLAPEARVVETRIPVPVPTEGLAPAPAPAPVADPGPEPYREIGPMTGAVWSVASAKDANTIVTGNEDGSFTVWDLETRGRRAFKANAHDAPILAVDISPDGSTVVTGGDDNIVKVWDISAGVKIKGTFKHDAGVRAVAFDSMGSRLVTGDRTGIVRVWRMGDDRPTSTFTHGGSISAVAFSPGDGHSGLMVGSVSTNKTAVLWSIPENRAKQTFEQHKGPVYGIAFSPDGSLVATSSWDKTIQVWEAGNALVKRVINAHDDGVVSVAFSSCGNILATAATDGHVKVFDITDGKQLGDFTRHRGTVHSVKFLPGCGTIITGGRDGYLRAWKVKH